MPTISFSLKDLSNLVGKSISIKQLEELVPFAKSELEGYDEKSDEVTLGVGDTNQPYLWSVEGLARLFKGVLGKESGLPELDAIKSSYEVVVDNSVKPIRPFVAAFVAKKGKMDDYLLKQMIQLQEKICDGFGRKRRKVAVGIYSYDKIEFPVHYKAVSPESVKFVPLEFKRAMTPGEILESHPKGKEYAHLLEGKDKYPLLVDSKDNVLSFPPITNSNFTGKVEVGDEHFFIEATGDDLDALKLAINIFAFAFQDRGFEINSVRVDYGDKKIDYPVVDPEKTVLKRTSVKNILGLSLEEDEVKALLEKARYGFKDFEVTIPIYRADILHEVDVVEDVGIMFGYDNIPFTPLTSYTIGAEKEIVNFIDGVREALVGFGYQEVMSNILSNKELLYNRMNLKDFGTVEIESYMSETFSVVRSWILPQLMDVLSKNKHVGYPQFLFEQGLITSRKKDKIVDYERVAVVSCHEKADYTEARQVLDALMRLLGVGHEVIETEHDSFIKGRVGRVSVNGKDVAYIGELSPKVLSNFGLEMPASGFELNLTELFNVIKK